MREKDISINYKNVQEFLKDDNLPIDHIFNELEELYNHIDKETELLVEEENIKDGTNEKEKKKKEAEVLKQESESLKQDFKSAFDKAKAGAKTNYTEADEKKERARQLLINEKLQQEVYRNVNNLKDNNYALAAARDPRAFMAQNKASLAVIPREQRQMMIPVNGQPPSNVSKGAMSALGAGLGGLRSMQSMMYLAMFVTNIPMMLVGIGGSLWKVVTFFWNSVSGNDIGNTNITKVKDKYSKEYAGITANLNDAVAKAQGRSEEEILDGNKRLPEAVEAKAKFDANTSHFEYETGWLSWYGLSRIIRYFLIGIILYYIVTILYKKVKQSNEKKKKEQYAQANKIAIQEITIDMLCEVSEEDAQYFHGMELIDESLGDWIKNIAPTPTNLLKLVNKGIIGIGGLAKSIQVGLKNESISPWLAKFCNLIIGLGNSIFMIVKGMLLGLIASFKNKAKVTNNKIEVNTLNKDNTNA